MYTMMFLYLICSVIYVFIGVNTYLKNRKNHLNQTFLVMCIVLFFWTFCLALMSATSDAKIATFFRILSVFSWASLYSLLLVFIIFLTERNKYIKSFWYYVVIFIPTFISIYLYVLDPVTIEHIVKIEIGWAFLNPTDKSFLWNVFFNSYYISYMIIVFVLLITWYRKTIITRQKRQAKIILVTMIATFLLGSLTDVIFPKLGIKLLPPITVFIVISIIYAIAYSMNKYGLMTITNEKVVSDVFKIMNEGLIILNHDYSINAINQGGLTMLGYGEKDLLYKNIEMIFDDDQIIDKFNHNSSIELEVILKSNEKLPILASTSVLLDNFGDRLGNLLIFQDLSKYKKIQNELELAYDKLEIKVKDRTSQLTSLNNQLGMEIEMRIEKEAQIKDLAFNDQLTGLPNRRSFNRHLDKTIKKAKDKNKIFAVLFLDLDGFKMINDTLGHDQGDYLLEKVATRLKLLFSENDYLARVGGDEFIVLIDNIDNKEDIDNICNMIIKSFSYPFNISIGDIYSSASIGVSIYPYDGINSKTLIKNADIAMYKSKESGKGKFIRYDYIMLENLDQTLRLTNDIHNAIELGELEVYYQPQNDTFTHEIIGVEALIRWNHPMLGIISPDRFIPIAEHTGLIIEIGEWILDQSCKDFKKLQEITSQIKSIGVNLSVNQIIDDTLVRQVKNTLEINELDAKYLELEITENFLINDTQHVLKILDDLKSINIRIAVDDFGTDYSSLKYLKKLPLDRIKIAKNFVDGIGHNKTDESIISAIVFLGEKLSLNLIAEGVENQSQLEFLTSIGCPEIQGFYFHKPMKFSELQTLLLNSINKSSDASANLIKNKLII